MNVLVTGSKGFIGSHLIKSSVQHCYIPFSFKDGDIDAIDFSNVDTIVHLAALVHQMDGALQEAYFEINTLRTISFAQQAKELRVKHFIFMSTVKVYGEENDAPYTEASPCHPVDDYGKSKLAAEEGLKALEDDNFIVSIIRTPIVYGMGVKGNIRNLIHLVDKIPVLPFDNIHNKRSMVYVGNLCHLLETIIAKKISGIFIAADDEPLSTTELIQKTADALGVKRHLVTVPSFASLLRRFKPSMYQRLYGNLTVDNTLTKQQLNFQNPYSSEEGIKLMIQGNL